MILAPLRGELCPSGRVGRNALFPGDFMRSCLLWLIGVPIPIIIILWLITGHA
jgi:hypothetical protein